MDELAARFEAERPQLRALAYRMLGTAPEADDAIQEAWLRLGRVDVTSIDNLAAWLRTVLTRICLDLLRSRTARREDLSDQPELHQPDDQWSPEDAAVLADDVGRALMVVLGTLDPVERIAFVLHDMFAVPFDQIAPIVDRTPVAAKKLASRARRKVQGTPVLSTAQLSTHRRVVGAFLDAARDGDLAGVLKVLAPDVVRSADVAALPAGAQALVTGAQAVAQTTMVLGKRGRFAELAMVDGTVGIVVAPGGRLRLALTFAIDGDLITSYDVIADPDRLHRLSIAVLR